MSFRTPAHAHDDVILIIRIILHSRAHVKDDPVFNLKIRRGTFYPEPEISAWLRTPVWIIYYYMLYKI